MWSKSTGSQPVRQGGAAVRKIISLPFQRLDDFFSVRGTKIAKFLLRIVELQSEGPDSPSRKAGISVAQLKCAVPSDQRSLPDRRRGITLKTVARAFYGGRRKAARREEDRGAAQFLDVYRPRLLAALLGLFALSLLDNFFTLALIQQDIVVEANPVMAFFLQFGEAAFTGVKIALTILAVTIFCLFNCLAPARLSLAAVLVAYGGVVLYELHLLYRYVL